MAGTIADNFVVARFNPGDLTPDTSFGGTGAMWVNFGSPSEATGVAIQTDGKIVVAGVSQGDFAVRFNRDGSVDRSFGDGGRVLAGFGSDSDYVDGVAIDPDGKIVLAGDSSQGTTGRDFAVVRLDP